MITLDRLNAIVLFGMQGVGKSTQAKLLLNDDFYYVSTGKWFVEADKSTTEGRMIRELIDAGNLVPDELTMQYFYRKLSEVIVNANFPQKRNAYDPSRQILLLDGIPRTVPQRYLLEERVHVLGAILYSLDEQKCIDRINHRVAEGLEIRADDNDPEAVMKRIRTFKSKTMPIIETYRDVYELDASGTIDSIHERSKEVVDTLIRKVL